MADIPNRDELERKFARILGRLLSAYGGRLLEKLGDPPDLNNIPAEFWDDEAREMLGVIRPYLNDLFLSQAERLLRDAPSGVEWGQMSEAAVEWARRYTFDLVRGINTTTQAALQRAVSGYLEREGVTRGELEQEILQTIASPVRAEMIAVTEITRAAVEGEREIVKELADNGIRMQAMWQTNNDELVCEICGPRNGKPIDDGFYPPAHPRCRCWINHELLRP